MYTESYLKYLLSDNRSLEQFFRNNLPVGFDDIKRNILLIERENNISIPDHYYRLGLTKTFEGLDSISKVLTNGINRLANDYLEYIADGLYVKAERQNIWQLLLPYMPPSVLIASMIWRKYTVDEETPLDFIVKRILPTVRYTCLLSPYIPQLENYKKKCGFTDLHLHLNGALESDVVWQDMLAHPTEIYKELSNAQNNAQVKELYSEIGGVKSADEFRQLLCIASKLRQLLCDYILFGTIKNNSVSLNALIRNINDLNEDTYPKGHPLQIDSEDTENPVAIEIYMYIKIFNKLATEEHNETIATLFYYYLLIMGYTNKMLVQQPSLFGFQEFQKYTSNGFREFSERTYNRRFFQFSGNNLNQARFIEGRFSPKDSLEKNESIVEKILYGWDNYIKERQKIVDGVPKLSLIAHFIKKKEKIDGCFQCERIRFYHLRVEYNKKCSSLISFKNCGSRASKYLVGVDCAASEFDTPPEVLAPIYRKLRDAGFTKFTYHAGEDFFHILSGLRAIYESIKFLGLKRGDRIGHATAAGVSVELWNKNLGNDILVHKGEYLDDLIFAYHLILNGNNENLKEKIPMLALRIGNLAYEVYQKSCSLSILVQAWLYRENDPIVVNEIDTDEVNQLFFKYHSKDVRSRYDEIISVATYDIFDAHDLEELQKMVLAYMHDNDIVIETLPTSNVIIGHHHSFSSYHLYNWMKWGMEGCAMPPIVVGTDDAGIFATSIYNEYCNIYCMLKYDKKMNDNHIIRFINQLDYNAELYRF